MVVIPRRITGPEIGLLSAVVDPSRNVPLLREIVVISDAGLRSGCALLTATVVSETAGVEMNVVGARAKRHADLWVARLIAMTAPPSGARTGT